MQRLLGLLQHKICPRQRLLLMLLSKSLSGQVTCSHFVSNSIDENKVIHDFYTKTENVYFKTE